MIKVRDLSIDLGEFHLRDIDLDINKGEYMVLLGPTGAGKTVLVECIVGLFNPPKGSIFIGDRNVVGLYPEERNVGYVPQDYALFPNMTVKKNIAYGLEARKLPTEEIEERVDKMMAMLGIEHLHYRYPLNLSGGEKQRVALGRALVTEPEILLLDEPLSALDENLRSELAAELRQIQRQSGAIFLHVCHSFEEASDLADRIAIMKDGRIAQVGTIDEVLTNPKNLFVARFARTRNFMKGKAQKTMVDGEAQYIINLECGENLHSTHHSIHHPSLDPKQESADGMESEEGGVEEAFREVMVAIRPEDIEVLGEVQTSIESASLIESASSIQSVPSAKDEDQPGRGVIFATLKSSRLKLTHMELEFEGKMKLIVNIDRKATVPENGTTLMLRLSPDLVRVFDC